jgi:mono/diheme cytochrome c family protein
MSFVRWGGLVAALTVGCSRSEAAGAPDGAGLYAAACAKCHGAAGEGGAALWDGGPSPPSFREGGPLRGRADADVAATVRAGKGVGMPAFGGTLSDDQITAVVRYARTLEKNRGKTP